MDIHSVTARRAIDYFGSVPKHAELSELIKASPHAILGGADFPDFLYACGKYADHKDAGEVAHWPRFQAAAANYIRSLPDFHNGNTSKWTSLTKNITTFFFGVTVHYVVDELWEGLTPQLEHQGMIELVDGLNLGMEGKGDLNETVGNIVADFYASWILPQSNIEPWDRFFPVEAVVDIYHATPEQGYGPGNGNFTNVTAFALKECKVIFDLGLWAIKEFGALLFPYFAQRNHQVPFIAEHVFDQPLSGIEDMAAMTTFAWGRFAEWLTDGPPPFDHVSPQSSQAKSASDEDDREAYALFSSLKPFSHHVPLLKTIPAGAVQSYFKILELDSPIQYHGPVEHQAALTDLLQACVQHWTGKVVEIAKEVPDRKERENDQEDGAGDNTIIVEGTNAASYTGSAMAGGDFDGDGSPDVAVSAWGSSGGGTHSQRGAVRCVYNGTNGTDHGGTVRSIEGDNYRGRFGFAMVTLDFNMDGVDDLAVSAPGYSGFEPSFANKNGTSPYPPQDDGPTFHLYGKVYVLLGKRGVGLPSSLDDADDLIVLSTKKMLRGLGQHLFVGDIVSIFFSFPTQFQQRLTHHFSHSSYYSKPQDLDGHDDLMMGCPLDRNNSGSLIGVVSSKTREGGNFLDVDVPGVAEFILSVPSADTSFSWFGHAALTQGNILLVGAPYHKTPGTSNVRGAVHAYWLNRSTHETSNNAPLHYASISGAEHLEQFGHGLHQVGDGNDTVVAVSSPCAGYHISPGCAGRVTLWKQKSLGSLFNASVVNIPAQAIIHGTSPFARFGTSMASSNAMLVVGAPFYTANEFVMDGREKGIVFGFDRILSASGNLTSNQATWSLAGKRPRARFGSVVSCEKDNNDRVFVGSPLAIVNGMERAGVLEMCPPYRISKIIN